MSTSSQFKKGLFFNYLNAGIGFVIMLFVIPLAIRALGKEAWGLYETIGSLVAYLHMLEFGMGGTITRYVAKFLAENDTARCNRFMGMVLKLYCAIFALTLLVGVALYFTIHSIFAKSIGHPEDLYSMQQMLVIVVVSCAIGMFGTTFSAIISGHGRVAFPRFCSAVSTTVRLVLILVVIFRIPTAAALTAASALGIIASTLLMIWYAVFVLKVSPRWREWEWPLMREVALFSSYNFAQEVMANFYWKIGTIILGVIGGSGLTAIYGIGLRLGTNVLQFSNSFSGMLLPHATVMAVENASVEKTTEFVVRVARLVLFLYGGMTIGFIFFGRRFVTLWAGSEFADAYWVVVISLLGALIPRIQTAATLVLRAKNLHGFLTLCLLLAGVLNVILAVALFYVWGIIGICVATSISLFVGNVLVANWYFQKRGGIDVKRFFIDVFSDKLVPYAVCTVAGLLLCQLRGMSSIVILGIQAVALGAVYVASMYMWGTNGWEKQQLAQAAGSVIRKFKVGA